MNTFEVTSLTVIENSSTSNIKTKVQRDARFSLTTGSHLRKTRFHFLRDFRNLPYTNIWNKKTQNVSSAIPETHHKYAYISFLFRFHSILINWLKFRRLTSGCCHPVGIPSSGALFWFDFRILRHLQMWNNIKIIGRRFRKVTNVNVQFRWISPYFQFFLFEWRFADWPWNVVILLAF